MIKKIIKKIAGVGLILSMIITLTAGAEKVACAKQKSKTDILIENAKKEYGKMLKNDDLLNNGGKHFCLKDLSGDKVPELIIKNSKEYSILTYNGKRAIEVSYGNASQIQIKYNSKKRYLLIEYSGNVETDGEGGTDEWEHIKSQKVNSSTQLRFKKSGKIKSTISYEKWYTTYTSKYKNKTEYFKVVKNKSTKISSKSFNKSFKSARKGCSKLRWYRNNKTNWKKLHMV